MPDATTPLIASALVADTIERLLAARRAGATVCPSEVARALAGDDGPWRDAMPRVREIAATMAREGRLRVTRRGVEVDALSPGGPIRLGPPGPPVLPAKAGTQRR